MGTQQLQSNNTKFDGFANPTFFWGTLYLICVKCFILICNTFITNWNFFLHKHLWTFLEQHRLRGCSPITCQLMWFLTFPLSENLFPHPSQGGKPKFLMYTYGVWVQLLAVIDFVFTFLAFKFVNKEIHFMFWSLVLIYVCYA